jgi:hypothetical protein
LEGEKIVRSLFAMRRANGDWFALDDHGDLRVPIFCTREEAMLAHSRNTEMECFRPVTLDKTAFKNLTTTDQGRACYWLIENPLIGLSRGRPLDHQQLALFIENGGTKPNGGSK